MAKQKEKEAKLLEKAAKSNATGQNNGMRKSQRRNSDKNLAGPNTGPVEATKPLTARQKSLQESTKVKKQKSKPMPPPQTQHSPQRVTRHKRGRQNRAPARVHGRGDLAPAPPRLNRQHVKSKMNNIKAVSGK